jgi:hypothetical protein
MVLRRTIPFCLSERDTNEYRITSFYEIVTADGDGERTEYFSSDIATRWRRLVDGLNSPIWL